MSAFVVLTSAFLTAATVTTGLLISKGIRIEMALPTPLEMALKLRPFVVPTDPRHDPDPESLERVLDELGGLAFMRRSLSQLKAEAKRRLAIDPGSRFLYERATIYIRELRFLVIPCCWVESRAAHLWPAVPQVFLWVTARLYYELNMVLHAMLVDL